MTQLDLFNPLNLTRRELQVGLERFDLTTARRHLEEFSRLWSADLLEWEIPVLDFFESHDPQTGLDSGYGLWSEFEATPCFTSVPAGASAELRRNYFGRLLAASSPEARHTRTVRGLSVGHLKMLAGQLNEARRTLEKEVSEWGDSAEIRLRLGQCNFLLGETKPARIHFREALLQGWMRLDEESIPDSELLQHLRRSSEGCWAVIEACVEGELPIEHFPSLQDFRDFLASGAHSSQRHRKDGLDNVRQFYRCLVMSENRKLARGDDLVQARLMMKRLHPRLHRNHLRLLESREQTTGIH